MDPKCIICGSKTVRYKRQLVKTDEMRTILKEKYSITKIPEGSVVCQKCKFSLIVAEDPTQDFSINCVICGCSIRRRQSYSVHHKNTNGVIITDVIAERISPRTVNPSSKVCCRCYLKCVRDYNKIHGNTKDTNEPSKEPINEVEPIEDTIFLSQYAKAPQKPQCLFPKCPSTVKLDVPLSIRKRLFADYKYYIPPQSKICRDHLIEDKWHQLFKIQINRIFTESDIYNFTSLLQSDVTDYS